MTEAFVKQSQPITLHNNITKISIPSNSYNEDFVHLNLVGFPVLKELDVGDHCFGSVEDLNMESMENIESIHIGESSFYNTSSVVIQNLPQLETIEIDEDGLYCNGENATLVLQNLPVLTNITSENNSLEVLRQL